MEKQSAILSYADVCKSLLITVISGVSLFLMPVTIGINPILPAPLHAAPAKAKTKEIPVIRENLGLFTKEVILINKNIF